MRPVPRLLRLAVVAAIIWVASPLSARGDQVVLKDGTTVVGTVTDQTPEVVTIQTADGVQTILMSRVAKIVKGGGKPEPSHEGKVQYKGRWVTPEEKSNLEAGKILYKNQWILPEEKVHVDKGLVRYKNRWVKPDEKEKLDQGLALLDGKWLKREEVEAARKKWANAWEVSSKRYLVRTNTSEDTAFDLLALLDGAMTDFKRILRADKAEPAKPMVVHLFREASEYEDWCRLKKADVYAAQPDFYDTKENVLALCQRDMSPGVFYPWVVGAAFSQFEWTCFQTKFPDWLEYGLRCYFQAGRYEKGKLQLGGVYKAMLPTVQDAMASGKHLKLRSLLQTSAAAVAGTETFTLFQAEAWSLIRFLENSKDEKWRKLFGKLLDQYLKADLANNADVAVINAIAFKIFEKVFGKDADLLETQWIAETRLLK